MDPDQSDVFHVQIKDRLDKTKDDVAATLKLMTNYQKQIQAKIEAAGRRPRFNEAQLNQRIKDIEFEMMTTNMSKKEEDLSLRRINSIRADIKMLDDFKEIDALKYRLKVTQERLDLQRKAVKELTSGLRKLEVIRKIFRTTGRQIALKEVLEKDLALQDNVVGDFIGFKGQNIRRLESEFCVVLDYEARYKVVHICGSAEGVAAAEAAIAEINTYVTHKIEVDEIASRILYRGSPLKEALEKEHRVRLDVPNAPPRPGTAAAAAVNTTRKYEIAIRGPPNRVETTAGAISAYLNNVDEVDVPSYLVQFVVGQKGATISELQETHDVKLFMDRPLGGRRRRNANTTVKCKVFGSSANRSSVLVAIKAILDEHEEIEERIPFDRAMVP